MLDIRIDRCIQALIFLCGLAAIVCGDSNQTTKATTERCHSSYFECKNGLCIKANLRCNLVNDCPDGSDEMDCDVKTAPTSCSDDEYLCKSPPMCISIDDLCTDFNECWDYDAIDTLCPITCQPHKFKCHNVSQCVDKKHLCDKSKDCMDGSDELNCDDPIYKCEEEADSFLCDDKSLCIFATDVCDGFALCDDGSDEKNDCQALCKEKKCGKNQLCLPEGQGIKCVCKDGFHFDKDNNCIEYNHCDVSDMDRPCSQICIEGRYGMGPRCRCISGYSLEIDGKSCNATGPEALLYVATASEIHQWSFETQSYDTIIDGLKGLKGLAFDSLGKRIFWSEIGDEDGHPEVLSMEISGGKKTIKVISSFGLQKPEGLAYDFLTKNVYIVDSGIPAILTCDPSQQFCVTVFNNTVVNSPREIVLNPSKGSLYYTELGSEPAIMKGSMDGSSFHALVNTHVYKPRSLHLDLTTNRLYWIDSFYSSGHVFRVDLDGTNKKGVLNHKITSAMLLTIFEDGLYWFNGETKSVMVENKFTGDHAKRIFQYDNQPMAVVMDHKSLQNDHVINRCHNKRCHMCLLNEKDSSSCFCTRGYQVASTNLYCEKVEAPSFLLMSDKTQILMFPLNETRRHTASYIKTPHMNNVNKLSYLPKSHGILYSSLSQGEASIEKIPGMDSWTHRSVKVLSVKSVVSIAADEASSTVFWTDYERKSIRIASLDGAFNRTLPIKARNPIALCVDPAAGTLFFSDVQPIMMGGAVIKKCSLDGQACSKLVSSRIRFPNHLLAQGQQLYWSDSMLGAISMINQWGNDRATLVVTSGNPVSFAIDSGILYWIEFGKKRIFYKHIHHEGRFEGTFETGTDSPQDLIAVVPHDLHQTACTHLNGGCEQICISIKRSMEVTCMCSEGFRLHQDKKQCVKDDGLCGGHVCNKFDCQGNMCQTVSTCSEGEFQCDNGRCIIDAFKCDGDDDCRDGSDESSDLHCSPDCDPEDHVCDEVKCFARDAVCDGFMDCNDESDEVNCDEEKCDDDEISCGQNQCISKRWVCDGMDDCDDGRDENGCKVEDCREDEFPCKDGECIDKYEVCDGFKNCMEGEDEDGCPPSTVHTCHESEYKCFDGECIHKLARCDGHPDCIGNEDEKECNDLCSENEFQCASQECIPYNLVCNLKNDCQDGSDEADFCVTFMTTTPTVPKCKGFMCASGRCIHDTDICNGVSDCIDNEDEVNCDVKSCKNTNCSQICVDDPSGVRCECEPGYRLKYDGLACEDIDECEHHNGNCSQKCINVKGHHLSSKGLGFKCQCFNGFEISQDYYSCKLKGRQPKLYISSYEGIRLISIGQRVQHASIFYSGFDIYKTVVDSRRASIYLWSGHNGNDNTLSRWEHVQKEPQIIFETFLFDFALDWITENVYITHFPNDGLKLSVLKCLSNNSVLLFDIFKGEATPHHVVLHPVKGQMFYLKNHTHFYRSSMDGKRPVMMPLTSTQTYGNLVFFALDTIADRLYWIHPISKILMSITTDDKDLLSYDMHTNLHKLRSLNIFGGMAYCRRNNSILSFALNKGAEQGFTTLARLQSPSDVEIEHPLKQPIVPNPCDRKECMYMCLLAENGEATCVCPRGMSSNYQNSCEGPKVPLNEVLRLLSNRTTAPSVVVQESQEQSTEKPQQQQHTERNSLVFFTKCTLTCLNGGSCVTGQGVQFCRCFDEFEGARCERRKEEQKKTSDEEEEDGFAWVAGLVIGLALLVLLAMFALWYFKYKRHNRSLTSSISFKKQNKFVICNQEDHEGLVPEISFGNPGFQEEIDEEAHMHEDHHMNKDQDWWKKLLSRSRRSVDSAFHSKNSVVDDGIDRFLKGDPQDPVMSDKVKLLK